MFGAEFCVFETGADVFCGASVQALAPKARQSEKAMTREFNIA